MKTPRSPGDERQQRFHQRLAPWLISLSLLLLLVIGAGIQSTLARHRALTRGRSPGFPAPLSDVNQSRLGINVSLDQYTSDAALRRALDLIEAGGFVWLRQPFLWDTIESEPGQYDWRTTDRILAALAQRPSLRLVAVLQNSDGTPPDDHAAFARFAGAFAARYGDRIDHYQIWDDPNLASGWGGGPVSPPAYADLLAHSARAIRAADGETTPASAAEGGLPATIILAGLSPTTEQGPQNLSDVHYLARLYEAGAAAYFDAAAGKPYGFYTGPDDRRAAEHVLNASRLILLREVMDNHGDKEKPLWASHWGWNAPLTQGDQVPSPWGVTDETTQAAHTVAMLERAQDEWAWNGPLILQHLQPAAPADDLVWGFALLDADGEPRPVYRALATWTAAQPHAAPPGGYRAQNPWSEFEGDWDIGPLGANVRSLGPNVRGEGSADAQPARASFTFAGPAVAVTVRRGPYRAYLTVTVDGAPANALPRNDDGEAYVVLYDETSSLATIPLAQDLGPGPHTVELTPQRGQGQWLLVDWRVATESPQDGFGWKLAALVALALTAAIGLLTSLRWAGWKRLAQAGAAFSRLPSWQQWAVAGALTGLFWLSAGRSWGCWGGPDLLSPWLALNALAAGGLTLCFAIRPVLGLAVVACAAPFYMHPSGLFATFSLPEALTALCALALATRTVRGWRRGARPWRRLTSLDWAMGAFAVASLAAGLAADDVQAALFELRTAVLLPLAYYGLLRAVRLSPVERWRVVDVWMAGAGAVALIGLAQMALGTSVAHAEGGLPRLMSVYYSPNNVALYLGRAWPLLAAVVLEYAAGRRRRRLYALLLLPVTLALALTFSRGALLLALPAAVLAIGWQAGGRARRLALVLVALGALALIPLLSVPRFGSLLDLSRGSSFFRLSLWRSTLRMIADHPWLGVGPGNFQAAYRTRYILPQAWSEPNLHHAHNVMLDLWARVGVPGLAAWIALQAGFWRALLQRPATAEGRRQRALRIGLLGSMAAVLAHGLVDTPIFYTDLAMITALMVALAVDLGRRDAPDSSRSEG